MTPLVVKMFKPIKIAGSRATNEFGIDKLLIAKADTQFGATDTPFWGEADAAVRQELTCFDLANRGPHQLTEFTPLLASDRGFDILSA